MKKLLHVTSSGNGFELKWTDFINLGWNCRLYVLLTSTVINQILNSTNIVMIMPQLAQLDRHMQCDQQIHDTNWNDVKSISCAFTINWTCCTRTKIMTIRWLQFHFKNQKDIWKWWNMKLKRSVARNYLMNIYSN